LIGHACHFTKRIIGVGHVIGGGAACRPGSRVGVFYLPQEIVGESELWQVLLPGGLPIDKCPKSLAEQYLKDHWSDFQKYVKDSGKFPGLSLTDKDLSAAIADIENITAIPDNIFNAIIKDNADGVTLKKLDPPISYIKQSAINTPPNDDATIAELIDHEAMHAAFASAGDDVTNPNEDKLIYPYLANNPVSKYAAAHPCAHN